MQICQHQINGLVQDCSISIASALEILRSCTKPWRCLFFRDVSDILIVSGGTDLIGCDKPKDYADVSTIVSVLGNQPKRIRVNESHELNKTQQYISTTKQHITTECLLYDIISNCYICMYQGSLCVCAQPIRDDITL